MGKFFQKLTKIILVGVLILFSLQLSLSECFAASASLSLSAVNQGQITRATWTGFTGAVTLKVFYGSGSLYATASTTNTAGWQDLDTTGWPISNYYVTVAQNSNPSINATSTQFSVNSKPDIVAVKSWLSTPGNPCTELSSPKVGDQVYLNFDLRVDNASAYAPVSIKCYKDNSLYYLTTYNPTVSTGVRYTRADAVWTVPAGQHTIQWVLDEANQVPETNEGNNSLSRTYDVADQMDLVKGIVTIKDSNGIPASGMVGQNIYFGFDYSVVGSGSTNPFSITCDVNGSQFWQQDGIVVTNGSYSVTTAPYTISDSSSKTVSCHLDPYNAVQETNEGNNDSSSGWTPNNFTPPNLTSPVNGSTVTSSTPSFTWSQTTGFVDYYYVQIASDSEFSNLVADIPNRASAEYTSATLTDGAYWWRVKAHDTSGIWSSWATSSFTVNTNAIPSWLPLFRLYNGLNKDHFYTTSAAERDSNVNKSVPLKYTYERVEGFVSSNYFIGSVPFYRYYNASRDMHYLTTNASDGTITSGGFTLESTNYIYQNQNEWTSPLYHTEHVANSDHFYTTSKYEYQHSINTWGFADRGIVGYVATRIANNRPQGNFAGVGMATGNFSLPSFTDVSLNGVGPQLSFTRFYDSFAPGTTLGQGWSFNYDSYILEDASGVHVEWGNGSESHFNISLTPYAGYFEKIVKINDGMNYGYDVTTKDQTEYKFRRFSLTTPGPNILLITVTDKFGNSMTLGREASYGVVTTATDPTGRIFNYTYTPVTISESRTVQRLTKVTDTSLSPNRIINLAYNAQGNLASVTDARGNTTLYTYNSDGFLNGITYPEGNSATVNYDLLMRANSFTAGGITLTFDYNATTGTTVKSGATTLVNYVPDNQYRASQINYPDGTNSKPTYLAGNFINLPGSTRDRNGKTSSFTYDANGNLLTATNAMGETTTYTYDLSNNNLLSVKDPRNNTTSYTYDPANGKKTLKSITKPMGGVTTFNFYFANGLVQTITDPTGHSMTYSYDANGNVTKINDNALSTSIDFTNDNAGRRLTKTDQQRPTPQLTTWGYDNNNNVISMQVNSNPAALFRYDKNNRLYNVVDPRGKTTAYTYNAANLLETQQSPDLKVWQYHYDNIGNLAYVDLPDSTRVNYSYYPNNRLQDVKLGSTEKLYYTYDYNGNVQSVRADGGINTSFTYDNANRITDVTDNFGNKVYYEYDPAGNRSKIYYDTAKTKAVTYTFDADNRLSTVQDWLNGTTTYNYNTAGILQSVTNANGSTTTYGYDTANRLTSLANKKSTGSVIADYVLALDKVGNPTSITRNEPLAPPIPAVADITYGYDDANQIQNAGSATYTHDGLGNLSGASNSKSFVFDYANRLASATIGSDSFSFMYDAFGNRISRTKNATQTKYLLDLNAGMTNVLAEADSAGTVQNYYIHGLGLISRINNSGQRSTYHFDQLGNSVAVTDASNTITESYIYDEFGSVLTSSGSVVNPFRYVGKYGVVDEDNGLLHMRARYYDTETGRFLSRDPLGFASGDLNLYSYTGDNPVIRNDPEGTDWSDWVDAGFKLVDMVKDPAFTAVDLLQEYGEKAVSSNKVANAGGNFIYKNWLADGYYSDEVDAQMKKTQHGAETVKLVADSAYTGIKMATDLSDLYEDSKKLVGKKFTKKIISKRNVKYLKQGADYIYSSAHLAFDVYKLKH